MFKESIPCCYFPTKVIIVDDNQEFSKNLSFALKKKFHSECFVSPHEALIYLTEKGELTKTLLSQHVSISEEYIPSAVTVDVKIASLREELHNQYIRFDRPVVLVVDYAMPEMNGLDFCAKLSGLPYKKIMLTGEADYDFAVEAFNQGKIDRFVKKGEKDYLAKIQLYIEELNIAYFNQLSQGVFDVLSKNGHDILHSEPFIQKFNEAIAKHDIVEFYLADETGSYIFLDKKGNTGEFTLRTEKDMHFFAEFAENDGMQSMADAIAARKQMPRLVSGGEGLIFAQDWKLCDANILHDGNETYYYSVTGDEEFNEHEKMLVSYHQYLYGEAKAA